MNRFSISQLENARRDPISFAKSLSSASQGYGSFSRYMAWLFSVYNFHKHDLQAALAYFDAVFNRNFVPSPINKAKYEDYVQLLHVYSQEYDKLNLNFVEYRKRLEIILTDKVKISGELPIISMNDKLGYTLYFFIKESNKWQTELKFPVVQDYIANSVYGVSLAAVDVGVFDIEAEKFSLKTYSNSDVTDAINELKSLGKKISKNL